MWMDPTIPCLTDCNIGKFTTTKFKLLKKFKVNFAHTKIQI